MLIKLFTQIEVVEHLMKYSIQKKKYKKEKKPLTSCHHQQSPFKVIYIAAIS